MARVSEASGPPAKSAGRPLSGDREAIFRHDVRSTLASIRAGLWKVDRTHRAGAGEEVSALVRAIDAEAARLQRMLENAPTGVPSFDLVPLLEDLAQLYRARGLATSVVANGGSIVESSPDAVVEIVANLLDNVETHAPGATAQLRVHACAGGFTVVVADDGPGMSPDVFDAAFEKGVTTRADSTGGVGLFAARRLAEDVGARLTIERSNSAGTEVVIDLRGESNLAMEATT